MGTLTSFDCRTECGRNSGLFCRGRDLSGAKRSVRTERERAAAEPGPALGRRSRPDFSLAKTETMSDSFGMDSRERAETIREGNRAFNEGDIRKARDLFIKADYKDGLIRLGDHFMYEKKMPLLAYGYYKKAGYQKRIDEIFQRMMWALSQWIGADKFKTEPSDPGVGENGGVPSTSGFPDASQFQIHPMLRQTALDILKKRGIQV